jgi:predicted acyltransferase
MFFFMMRNVEATGMPDFNNFFRLQALFMVVLFPIMGVLQGIMLTYLKSAMMVVYLRLTRSSTSAPQLELQEAIS